MVDKGFPKTDWTYGVDRNQHSPYYGSVVLGGHGQIPIILWRRPACDISADNMTGALAHNHKVEVTRRIQYDGRYYYFIKADVRHEGKVYPQKGWVPADLLKELGKG